MSKESLIGFVKLVLGNLGLNIPLHLLCVGRTYTPCKAGLRTPRLRSPSAGCARQNRCLLFLFSASRHRATN
jgi:hypothetical protein